MDIPKQSKIGRKRPRFQSPNRKIRIDWKAYFNSFCEAHGMFPMEWGGRLLFPDGWTYSITDYSGPEYPPPSTEIELLYLQQRYWIERKKLTTEEHTFRKTALEDVRRAAATHTATLFHTWESFDAETKTKRSHSEAIDIPAMERSVGEIAKDLEECLEMLREIGHGIRLHNLTRSSYAWISEQAIEGAQQAEMGERLEPDSGQEDGADIRQGDGEDDE